MNDAAGIEAALTPEQWANIWHGETNDGVPAVFTVGIHEIEEPDRHAVAALALHNQPYGFTWEDVDLLRAALSTWDGMAKTDDGTLQYVGDQFGDTTSLADRIAALLPPRE